MSFSTLVRSLRSFRPWNVALAGVATTTTALAFATSLDEDTNASQHHQQQQQHPVDTFLEPDFMDRIRRKPYMKEQRERGFLPTHLRIMTIDVPELRHHLQGACGINYKASFEDGVAPDRILSDGKRITQATLAQSVYRCKTSSTIGLEVLETSVRPLNPNNVRRNAPVVNAVEKMKQSIQTTKSNQTSTNQQKKTTIPIEVEEPVPATEQDEVTAPWNQYAWPDELVLRLEGRVGYGAILEKSPWLSRVMGDSVYQPTIPFSKRWYEYMLPSFLCQNPAGMDGADMPITWASNMPHAVIANGMMLNRVPGFLSLLRKTCEDLDIPLFIIHDPRRWVSTNKDLNEALRELRQTVKANVIINATKGSGSAFSRGYHLGHFEANTKHQVKEQYQTMKNKITEVNAQLESDWSRLSVEQLEEKLLEHKVIQLKGKTKVYSDSIQGFAKQLLLLLDRKNNVSNTLVDASKRNESDPDTTVPVEQSLDETTSTTV